MKKLFIVVLCLCSFSSMARTAEDKADKDIIDYIKKNIALSASQYGEQYVKCSNNETGILPVDKFKSLQLTNNQLYIVLRYFNTVNFNECMGDSYLNAISSLAAAREFDIEKVSEQDDPTFKTIQAPTMYLVDEIEYKAKYLKIPQVTRNKIEQITELKKPFNMASDYSRIVKNK